MPTLALCAKANANKSGVTFAGEPHLALGGVGRNLATALTLLGHRASFVTSVARDSLGSFALAEHRRYGLSERHLRVFYAADNSVQEHAAKCCSCFALVLIDSIDGQCEYVIANLDAVRAIDSEAILAQSDAIRRAKLVVMDANLRAQSIRTLMSICASDIAQTPTPIFIEPTDVLALPQLVEALHDCAHTMPILCLSPNSIELAKMLELFRRGSTDDSITASVSDDDDDDDVVKDTMAKARELMSKHLPLLRCLLVTMDSGGVLVALRQNSARSLTADNMHELRLMMQTNHSDVGANDDVVCKLFKVPQLVQRPVSVSGAGDSFASGFISGLLDDCALAECMQRGFECAQIALLHRDTIPMQMRELQAKRRKPTE